MERIKKAFKDIKQELMLFGFLMGFIVFFAAAGIYTFEHEVQPEVFGSIFDSLWWAIVTLSTVGYGDSFPITIGGKIFTAILVLVGIGIVAVPTGLFASALSNKEAVSNE